MQADDRLSLALKIVFLFLALVSLRVNPSSYVVRQDLQAAQAAQEAGQPKEAAQSLRDVLAREPWRASLWEQVGNEAFAAGQMEEAVAALQKAGVLHALSADGSLLLGEAYQQLHRPREAEATWKDLLRREGPNPDVFDRLTKLQRAQGDYQGAIETLNAWHAYAPADARVSFLLGLHLCAIKPDEALPLLLDAAKNDGNFSNPVQTLRGGLALAATTDQPAYGWVMIGRSLGSIEQWDLAVEAFLQATKADARYGEAWAFLGEGRSHLGESGQVELEKARALAPDSSLVKALYALSLRRQGNYQEALGYLKSIAAKEPDEPFWQVQIGQTLADMGDVMTARTYFDQAIQLAPKSTTYLLYLVNFSIQYNLDVRGVALPTARQAVLLAPDDATALDAMGWTLANLEDYASAERFLQRSLEKDGTYAPASLHLGLLYLQQHKSTKAYFYLKQADNLAGDSAIGQSARRLLKTYFGEGS